MPRIAKGKNQSDLAPIRPTLWDTLGSGLRNLYCRREELSNEASVETFFVNRLLTDLDFKDAQIKTKESIEELAVSQGRRKSQYKPDYVLVVDGLPRCVVDAKGADEDIDQWVGQCSSYCLTLNQRYADSDPVRYFILSNGLVTKLFRWDHHQPVLVLDFGDFNVRHPAYEKLKAILSPTALAETMNPSLETATPAEFSLMRPTSEKARQLFTQCHRVIWKSDVFGPAPAFMEFVKVMFVKLWEDRKLRDHPATKDRFEKRAAGMATVRVPETSIVFSVNWIERREKEGIKNPIDAILFSQLRNDIESQILSRKKKRLFDPDEHIRLRSDTVKEIVRRLEHVDLFGIDEDLNGRLFETFLSATMRGRELGQFFTPRSIVKMMTDLAGLRATPAHQDMVIDSCCGSGGFLIEALTVMRNQIRLNESLNHDQREALINDICTRCFYGIDYGKEPPLARIARINMYLHGDGGSRIYYADGLDKDLPSAGEQDAEIIQNIDELREVVSHGLQFDVALTNPPFSMTKELRNESEARILKSYRLARRSETTSAIRPSLRSSVMFVERYHDLLKPGGRLLTVLDDTLLASSQFRYFRDFVRRNFLIRAIISLPGDAFRRQGSRVKTSVLVLEKKKNPNEDQPACFAFFASHLGLDDLTPRASESAMTEARQQAVDEISRIVRGYREYLDGKPNPLVYPATNFVNRLDLKHCIPLFGRLADQWRAKGITVRELKDCIKVVDETIVPADYPAERFRLLKVTYDGQCEVESERIGSAIKHNVLKRVHAGQIVFSKIRATDGAIGIVPAELDGAVVSQSSFMIFDAGKPKDTAYLWAVLRSHELRADMQSLSPGSSRYNTPWPEAGTLLVPWMSDERREAIGQRWIDMWDMARRAREESRAAQAELDELGIESAESITRWQAAKAPT